MKAIWSGSISFGLVNIPVKLFSALGEETIDFDLLHEKDLSPIRYARICKKDGDEIPFDEIVKGYEYEKGEYVILTDDDFENANVRISKTITILDFAREKEIEKIYYDKPYYLEPEKGSDKAYALLRESLKKSGKVGIGKYVLRNRERLVALLPKDNLLVLEQLKFKDDIRDYAGLKLPSSEGIAENELEMALSLIGQMTKPFNPGEYRDTYKNELMRIIKDKVAGRTPSRKGTAPTPTPIPDLVEVLKKSLEEQKAKSGK